MPPRVKPVTVAISTRRYVILPLLGQQGLYSSQLPTGRRAVGRSVLEKHFREPDQPLYSFGFLLGIL